MPDGNSTRCLSSFCSAQWSLWASNRHRLHFHLLVVCCRPRPLGPPNVCSCRSFDDVVCKRLIAEGSCWGASCTTMHVSAGAHTSSAPAADR